MNQVKQKEKRKLYIDQTYAGIVAIIIIIIALFVIFKSGKVIAEDMRCSGYKIRVAAEAPYHPSVRHDGTACESLL